VPTPRNAAAHHETDEGSEQFGAGMVSNVLVRIPGAANTGGIAINAHYDGGSTGPAAGDNGVGVVATIEVVRALLAGAPLANDLIIVFSDTEEHGDLGAAAFNQDHPWAKDVRMAINFEAQGTGGPAMLYATSDRDGWLTGQYLSVAPEPSAYSLLPELVRALPGFRLACDLEDYLIGGAAGLGFVIADNTSAYHTATDTVANVDRGSVQQEGGNTLAAVRHFGQLDLTEAPRSANRVYFSILPGVVMHYGGGWVIPLAAITTLLVTALIVAGYRRRLLSLGGLAVGMAALLLGSLLTVVVVAALWFAVKATNGDFQVLLIGPYQTDVLVAGLSLMAIALMSALYVLLQKWVRAENLSAGALVTWTLLMWATSLGAPGASYYLAWPLLFAVLPLAWTILAREGDRHPGRHLAVLTIAVVPAALLVPGISYQMVGLLNRVELLMAIVGVGFPLLGLWAIFIAPLVGLYLPHLNLLSGGGTRPFRWLVPGVTAAAAVLLIGWTSVTSGFDAEHPRPDHIAYELDADTGAARFISLDPQLDSWSSQFFPDDSATADFELQPGTNISAFSAPTAAVALESAGVETVADATANGVRTRTFRITSPRAAPELLAKIVAQGEIVTATIDGRPLNLDDYALAREGTFQFHYVGIDSDGIELTLAVRSTASIAIAVTETSYGLPQIPGLTVQPRAADQMQAPGLPPDATIVRRTFTI